MARLPVVSSRSVSAMGFFWKVPSILRCTCDPGEAARKLATVQRREYRMIEISPQGDT